MISLFLGQETADISKTSRGNISVAATAINIYDTGQIKDDGGLRLEFVDSEHSGFELDLSYFSAIELYEKLTPYILELAKENHPDDDED